MAKKSGKKTKGKELRPISDDDLTNLLVACNRHGIRCTPFWKQSDRLDVTYFLMPEMHMRYALIEDDVTCGGMKADVQDFIQFWHGLGNLHKERRFLANYMAMARHILGGSEAEIPSQMEKKEILSDTTRDFLWVLRRVFIEDQRNSGFRNLAARFLHEIFNSSGNHHIMEEIFKEPLQVAFDRIGMIYRGASSRRSFDILLYDKCQTLLLATMIWLIQTYFGWVAFDTPNLQRYLKDRTKLIDMIPDFLVETQDQYMKKLNTAAPHWRKEDRAYILRAIETNGESCRDTYVDRLLKAVGQEKFKVSSKLESGIEGRCCKLCSLSGDSNRIAASLHGKSSYGSFQVLAFGKEKFCGACGRSSYVGEERLWSCKRCCEEEVRPKARYCNVQCQKADWLKHKKEAHSGPKKESGMKMISAAFWESVGSMMFECRGRMKY